MKQTEAEKGAKPAYATVNATGECPMDGTPTRLKYAGGKNSRSQRPRFHAWAKGHMIYRKRG